MSEHKEHHHDHQHQQAHRHYEGEGYVPRPIELPTPPTGDMTLEELKEHLKAAMALELSTIPLYLYGAWSMIDGPSTNLIGVVIQEMLHLALAGNVLKAVGGTPVTYDVSMIPTYPSEMKNRIPPLRLDLQPATQPNINVFVELEKAEPVNAPPEGDKYHTIGQFYKAIENGLKSLNAELPTLFDPKLLPFQFPQAAYRNVPGNQLIDVHDLDTALAALEEIVLQGEGKPSDPRPPPTPESTDHYDIFLEMQLGNKWNVHNVPMNPTAATYKDNNALLQTSLVFDAAYCYLLLSIDKCWATSVASQRTELVNNISQIMRWVLKKISVFMKAIVIGSNSQVAAPCFQMFQFQKGNELNELKKQMEVAYELWPDESFAEKVYLTAARDAINKLSDINNL